MSATNWAAGQGLTWSGRWHIIDQSQEPPPMWDRYNRDTRRTLCGTNVYSTLDSIPKYHHKLWSIAHGQRTAPECKLCARSAAKP